MNINNLRKSLRVLGTLLVIFATSVAMGQVVKDEDSVRPPVTTGSAPAEPVKTLQIPGPKGEPGKDGKRIIIIRQVDGSYRAELDGVKGSLKDVQTDLSVWHSSDPKKGVARVMWASLTDNRLKIEAVATTATDASNAVNKLREELVAKGILPATVPPTPAPAGASPKSAAPAATTTAPKAPNAGGQMQIVSGLIIVVGIVSFVAIILAVIKIFGTLAIANAAENRTTNNFTRAETHGENVWGSLENATRPYHPGAAAVAGTAGTATTPATPGVAAIPEGGVRGSVRTNTDGRGGLRVQTVRELI